MEWDITFRGGERKINDSEGKSKLSLTISGSLEKYISEINTFFDRRLEATNIIYAEDKKIKKFFSELRDKIELEKRRTCTWPEHHLYEELSSQLIEKISKDFFLYKVDRGEEEGVTSIFLGDEDISGRIEIKVEMPKKEKRKGLFGEKEKIIRGPSLVYDYSFDVFGKKEKIFSFEENYKTFLPREITSSIEKERVKRIASRREKSEEKGKYIFSENFFLIFFPEEILIKASEKIIREGLRKENFAEYLRTTFFEELITGTLETLYNEKEYNYETRKFRQSNEIGVESKDLSASLVIFPYEEESSFIFNYNISGKCTSKEVLARFLEKIVGI